MNAQILTLDPATYVPHATHIGERDWAETNCYVDVWIELLHGLGHEPLAGLGFTVGIDLEADQWTFFKFPHDELADLYGITVIELNPWSSVIEQTANEVVAGRPVLIEVDAWFLPDTHGTTYRSGHTKTTIAVVQIDTDARTLGYFHNQSFHALGGDDFAGLFRLDQERFDVWHLPPFIEVAKTGTRKPREGAELAMRSLDLLRAHVGRAPAVNPFIRYATRFDREIEALRAGGGSAYHAYAFASFRQFGAAFSLAAAHLEWLTAAGVPLPDLNPAIIAFAAISTTAKTLQFRTARAALAGKPLDATPQLTTLADAWDEGIGHLRNTLR